MDCLCPRSRKVCSWILPQSFPGDYKCNRIQGQSFSNNKKCPSQTSSICCFAKLNVLFGSVWPSCSILIFNILHLLLPLWNILEPLHYPQSRICVQFSALVAWKLKIRKETQKQRCLPDWKVTWVSSIIECNARMTLKHFILLPNFLQGTTFLFKKRNFWIETGYWVVPESTTFVWYFVFLGEYASIDS